MTGVEKIIVVVLGLLSLSFLGYIISSYTSQTAPVAAAPGPERTAATVTPAVSPLPPVPAAQAAAPGAAAAPTTPRTEMPRPVLPAPMEGPEHVQAACMSNVRGLIPNGTRVNGMSVAYKHSVETSRPVHRQVSSLSDINFYTVTVEAEIEGRRFSSRYTCRQWGDAIQIMRP
jgi:hypothetical protein